MENTNNNEDNNITITTHYSTHNNSNIQSHSEDTKNAIPEFKISSFDIKETKSEKTIQDVLLANQPENVYGPSSTNKLYFGLTKRQLRYMAIFGLMNIFRAFGVLINGPFFPPEAEDRGATATEIGFIFSSFDFTVVFASIIHGKYLIKLAGPLLIVKLSIINTGICTIIFGCLSFINDHDLFVTLCFVIRIISGAGDAGLYPALFTIFAIEFPELVSTAVGMLEVFFGIGAILGPIVCGVLIDIIGYAWVYSIIGILLVISGFIGVLFLPSLRDSPDLTSSVELLDPESAIQEETDGNTSGYFSLLKIRTVWMAIFGLFATAASIGFITATLELHMEEFELSSTMTGLVFSVGTAFYVVSSIGWGLAADKTRISKHYLIAFGAFFVVIGFSFLGPLPFLSWEKSLWAIFVGYAIHGIGIGGSIMSAYSHALSAALENGFKDNSATYSIVSGIYTSTFSLGNSIGPSIGGVLFDIIGFRWGTLWIIGMSSLAIILALLSSWMENNKRQTVQIS